MGPTKIGSDGNDVDNEAIIDQMNKIDAEKDSDEGEEDNDEGTGGMDDNDGIQMEEDDGEEAKVEEKI